MALKDWKKLYENFWINNKSKEYIELFKSFELWVVGNRKIGKSFKTKAQAIKFAKAYMRKH
jgi:hypothetical protein